MIEAEEEGRDRQVGSDGPEGAQEASRCLSSATAS